MTSTIQIKVDDKLKNDSDALFKELGTDTTSAIRMFLKQAVMHKGFPFEIKMQDDDPYYPLSREQIYADLDKSIKEAAEGKVKDVDLMIAEAREKYGL